MTPGLERKQGGLVIGQEKVEDIGYTITLDHFQGSGGLLVRKGKKHYFHIRISG